MSKQTDKKSAKGTPPSAPAPEGFHWEIRPEPAATPRDRRWLSLSIAALVVWFAILGWLAFR